MDTKIKLTYFDVKFLGDAIRLTLAIGNIDFEDERLNKEEFELRRDKGEFPYKMLPVMTINGKTYGESDGLLRYAGKLTGLYPKCNLAAMTVDSLISHLVTVTSGVFSSSTDEAQTKFLKEDFPRYMGLIEAIYEKTEGPYLLGDQLSIADIKLAVFASMFNEGKMRFLPAGCMDEYTNIMGAKNAIESHEKVQAWYDARA